MSGVQIGAKSASGFCCCAFNSPGPFLDLYLFKNINSVDYFANSLHSAIPSLPQRDPLLFYFFFLSEAWREAPGKACRDFKLTVPSSAVRDSWASETPGRAAVLGGLPRELNTLCNIS